MILIGESIHVISPRVRAAIESRDKAFIQNLALQQVKAGANMLDLNIGPQKKAGPEVMDWMVRAIQEVTDTPLSLDTTNPTAIEAGLKVVKTKPLINSTDATDDRLNSLMPLAAKYNANIIALTLSATGLPTTADARIELASEKLLTAAAQYGVPTNNIFLDPLVMTVNGTQDQAQPTIQALCFFKQMTDPPCYTTCGLSNVSNSCPKELRPLLNRTYLVMLLGAGLDSAIADALDPELIDTIRTIDQRDDSTPRRRLYLKLYDTYVAGEMFDESGVDMSDSELAAIVKTIRVLENKTLYAHGYLRL